MVSFITCLVQEMLGLNGRPKRLPCWDYLSFFSLLILDIKGLVRRKRAQERLLTLLRLGFALDRCRVIDG
ncbi:Uncharacterized protein TCM_014341 [Theobroma cacao]|uniref:Uncharacterized protein n=1 Tax=Theobroma cacao TaxID=3641 RepID=A0A061FYK6_THECC|nr:Uncharacterized protein TCM_014341 [Theobroma cacao]